MKLICASYEETLAAVRMLSETATTHGAERKNIFEPVKPFEVKAAPAPVGPQPWELMDLRPEHKLTRAWK